MVCQMLAIRLLNITSIIHTLHTRKFPLSKKELYDRVSKFRALANMHILDSTGLEVKPEILHFYKFHSDPVLEYFTPFNSASDLQVPFTESPSLKLLLSIN